MSSYICAMTIGPIMDTIANADKSVQLWKGSFMFSCLSKNICERIEELTKIEGNTKEQKLYKIDENINITSITFITPYFSAEVNKEAEESSESSWYDARKSTKENIDVLFKKGVGVYHDHIIVEINVDIKSEKNKSDYEIKKLLNVLMENIIKNSKKETIEHFYSKDDYSNYEFNISDSDNFESLGNDIDRIGNNKYRMKKTFKNTIHDLEAFFSEYIYVRGYIKEKKTDSYDMIALSSPLNSMELETIPLYRYQADNDYFFYSNDFLKDMIESENISKDMSLIDYYISREQSKVKGIDDISLNGVTEKLKYRNYFAFVQADGDNMGKLLNQHKNLKGLQKFSDTCGKYACRAVDLVKDYGGVVFYAGGDDLMFLAPLIGRVNGKDRNILDLLNEIGKVFKQTFSDSFSADFEDKKCSLSFGASLIYRKFPMYDAFDISHNLLNSAKNAKASNANDGKNNSTGIIEKNRCAVEILKHSGKKSSFMVDGISDDINDDKHLLKIISELISEPITNTEKAEDGLKGNEELREESKSELIVKAKAKLIDEANRNYGSILSHLTTYRSLYVDAFDKCMKEQAVGLVENLNDNLMGDVKVKNKKNEKDDENEKGKKTMKCFNNIADYLISNRTLSEDATEKYAVTAETVLDEYISILRYCKFFTEKEVDDE